MSGCIANISSMAEELNLIVQVMLFWEDMDCNAGLYRKGILKKLDMDG